MTVDDNGLGANGTGEHEQRLGVELRRGIVTLAALTALRAPTYGYSLQQRLHEQGFEIDQGTLYPLLRRLDEQGLLDSDWSIDEGRPRKYYRLSAQGTEVLASLTAQWGRMVKVVDGLLNAFNSVEQGNPVKQGKPIKQGNPVKEGDSL
jgi:PadR family transcriptional regulator PadR